LWWKCVFAGGFGENACFVVVFLWCYAWWMWCFAATTLKAKNAPRFSTLFWVELYTVCAGLAVCKLIAVAEDGYFRFAGLDSYFEATALWKST